MNEAQIKQLIQNEIDSYMKAKQFTVSKIPSHIHNGTDANKIPVTSLVEFLNIPSTGSGVMSATTLGNQIATQGNAQNTYGDLVTPNQVAFTTFPIPIIYGNGVGVDSAFNGGDAPDGTAIFFDNGLTLSGLWVKTANGWYGFSPSSVI